MDKLLGCTWLKICEHFGSTWRRNQLFIVFKVNQLLLVEKYGRNASKAKYFSTLVLFQKPFSILLCLLLDSSDNFVQRCDAMQRNIFGPKPPFDEPRSLWAPGRVYFWVHQGMWWASNLSKCKLQVIWLCMSVKQGRSPYCSAQLYLC